MIDVVAERVDLDVLAEQITAAYRAELPSFAVVPHDAGEAALRPKVRNGLEKAVALLIADRPPLELVATDTRIAQELALGVAPDDAIRAIGIGGRMLWRALVDAATPAEMERLSIVPARVFRYLGGISRAAHEAARHPGDAGVEQANQLLFGLLADRSASRAHVDDAAAAVGVAEERGWSPVVLVPSDGQTASLLAMDLRNRSLPAAPRGDRVHALVPHDRIWHVAPSPGLAVAGAPCARWEEMPAAFAAVTAITELALRRGMDGLVHTTELPLELLLASSPELASGLGRSVIAPLEEHAQGDDLIATLDALLSNDLDRTRTATALHLHPNSVAYRVRSIVRLTGFDPAVADDLVTLVLGMTARDLGIARRHLSAT